MSTCETVVPVGRGGDVLRAHLPEGFAWLAWITPGKVAYGLMSALGSAFDALSAFFCYIDREADPYRTVDLLTEWQQAVGLPDPCFPAATSYERQIAYLIFRLTKRRWITAQDYVDLGAFFGLTVKVTPGGVVERELGYGYCYPVAYRAGFRHGGRFRLYVDVEGCRFSGYAYNYPLEYTADEGDCAAFLCLIRRITPANVIIIVNDRPVDCREEDDWEWPDEWPDEWT